MCVFTMDSLCGYPLLCVVIQIQVILYFQSTFIDQNPINFLKPVVFCSKLQLALSFVVCSCVISCIAPTEGLNEVRPAVYRAALKLRSLQKLCQREFFFFNFFLNALECFYITLHNLTHYVSIFQTSVHLVSLQDLRPVLNTLCSGEPMISLSQEDVQQLLEELFQSISHELPGQAVPEATDQTSRLLFKLFDR